MLLFLSFAIAVGAVGWGVAHWSERGAASSAVGPPPEVSSPGAAMTSDPSALPPERTEAAPSLGFAAERQPAIDEGSPAEAGHSERMGFARGHERRFERDREDVAASPAALAYERGLRAQNPDAALQALREAVELDPGDAGFLEAAGLAAKKQGHLEEAEDFFRRALDVREETLGPDDPVVARTLGQLGGVYADQRRYVEAETAYQRALAIQETAHGHRHVQVAAALSDLARLYQRLGRPWDAVPLLESALEIEHGVWGPQHPNVAARLSALGALYRHEGQYDDAEPHLEEALFLREQAYARDHPETIGALTSLAHLRQNQERYVEAWPIATAITLKSSPI